MRDCRWSPTAREAALSAIAVLHDGGYLVLCSGPKPKGGPKETPAPSTQVLAILGYGTPAFIRQSDTFVSQKLQGRALKGGTATWFRSLESDRRTPIRDGTIGAQDLDTEPEYDMILPDVEIVAGDLIEIEEDRLWVGAQAPAGVS